MQGSCISEIFYIIGRVIIIDVGIMNSHSAVLENISEALTDFFAICTNLPGIPKVQLFALYLFSDTVEVCGLIFGFSGLLFTWTGIWYLSVVSNSEGAIIIIIIIIHLFQFGFTNSA